MGTDALLQRLDRVRARGRDSWTARCPAHDDRGPSLSIKETADGTTLVHCFAGCDVESVLGAVGLELADLFQQKPAKPGAGMSRVRRPFTASDALAALHADLHVVAVVVSDARRGVLPTDDDWREFLAAAGRIVAVAEGVRT